MSYASNIPTDVVCIILKKIHPYHLAICSLVHGSWLRIIVKICGPFEDGWVTFVAQNGFPYNVVNRIRTIVSLGCKLHHNDCLKALRTNYNSEFALYLYNADAKDFATAEKIPLQSIMEIVVKLGDVHTMDYLFKSTNLDLTPYTTMAAEYGRLNILKVLVERGMFYSDSWVFAIACQNGHYECAMYAFQMGCSVDDIVLFTSIARNYQDVFEFVLDKMSTKTLERACRTAITHHRTNMLSKLIAIVKPTKEFGNELLEYAAKCGTLSTVQLLYGMGYTIKKDICKTTRWLSGYLISNEQTFDFLHNYANLCTCGNRSSSGFVTNHTASDILSSYGIK